MSNYHIIGNHMSQLIFFFFFREIPFTEAYSTASTGHQYQTTGDTKVVNTGQSKTVHVNPGGQPPLVIVSMKQPGTPPMSRGVVPAQGYARQNVQNFPKQVAAVPNMQGAQSATIPNMSPSQQFQTNQLRGQQFQQQIVQQRQPGPMQDQAVDSQGNPEQLDEEIALAQKQIEENKRKLLMYSQLGIVTQAQQVPHNANIQQLQNASAQQAQGLKLVSYNTNKVPIPGQGRGNVSIQSVSQGFNADYVGSLHLPNSSNAMQQNKLHSILVNNSPQGKVDVRLVNNNTGAPNRTTQEIKPQVITLSNTRPKMCVQQESQNPAFSQSNNFQQIGNQNIPVIRGGNPASANMSQNIPANQNWKSPPQNNSLTDCAVIQGARVELKGGGKFEEGQIYMVRNRSGQEKKMIWTGGELVNFKPNMVPGRY